jgi:hypothetical protein
MVASKLGAVRPLPTHGPRPPLGMTPHRMGADTPSRAVHRFGKSWRARPELLVPLPTVGRDMPVPQPLVKIS